uniref:Mitogen-activated protein kinase n=1 Tax=Aureoumbra lagunensis TaxID=44058 RepID=A0A7S3NJQ4_9STRA|mmetsp:Transcript_4401/g.6246  ORF Transcript_4401/g.6246 Transcript_4401/m.6246 type:complete len:613 (+) Transcript_4401:84-1922(+)
MSSNITHISSNDITIEGWLRKKGSLFSWRTYFVSVDANRFLSYYIKASGGRLAGRVKLTRKCKVVLDPRKENGFVLFADLGRTLKFAADSKSDVVLWKEIIESACLYDESPPGEKKIDTGKDARTSAAAALQRAHRRLRGTSVKKRFFQQSSSSLSTSTETKRQESSEIKPDDETTEKTETTIKKRTTQNVTTQKKNKKAFADFFYDPNKYVLNKTVGKGSYGLVVSGTDLRADTPCAIKKIGDAFADLVDAKRIVREIRLMHNLDHENILKIYDCYAKFHDARREAFDDIYIVTELLQTDLHDVIYARRPLSRAHVQYFAYQMLCGLGYMHSKGVVHRDIKCGNLLVSDQCQLKICDFGLARALPSKTEQQHLTEYVVTRWYRSPELLLSCRAPYDGAVDIWSVGCVIAEMVNRHPLFAGRDVIDQIKRVVSVIKAVRPRDVEKLGFVTNAKARAYVQSIEASERYTTWNQVVPKLADASTSSDKRSAGIDFVASLLRFDPANRPGAYKVLNHAFLASMRAELGSPNTEIDVPCDLADIEACPLEKSALRKILKRHDFRYTPVNTHSGANGGGGATRRADRTDESSTVITETASQKKRSEQNKGDSIQHLH